MSVDAIKWLWFLVPLGVIGLRSMVHRGAAHETLGAWVSLPVLYIAAAIADPATVTPSSLAVLAGLGPLWLGITKIAHEARLDAAAEGAAAASTATAASRQEPSVLDALFSPAAAFSAVEPAPQPQPVSMKAVMAAAPLLPQVGASTTLPWLKSVPPTPPAAETMGTPLPERSAVGAATSDGAMSQTEILAELLKRMGRLEEIIERQGHDIAVLKTGSASTPHRIDRPIVH